MDASSLVLGLRVLLSLTVVLGLLWFAARRLAGTGAVRRQRTAALSVVARQSLGGRTGVALVEIEGRRLLLGVSEHGVNLLTEVEAPAAEPAGAERGPRAERADRVALEIADLERSLLGPATDPSGTTADDVRAPVTSADDADPAAGPTDSDTDHPSTPAARMPAVPTPRNPLEGSILDVTTWRQAVVAVQERTIRR